jgi:hypothetical protein
MDTKLKTILFIGILSMGSCNTSKKFVYHFEDDTWIKSYKTYAFCSCFSESYKNDSIIKMIGEKDFINQSEIIANWEIIDRAKNLGANIAKNIPKPIYPKFEEGKRDEFYKKNYYLVSCLNYYASKELDIIAKKEYKKQMEKLKHN